jgi:hypothetical protein
MKKLLSGVKQAPSSGPSSGGSGSRSGDNVNLLERVGLDEELPTILRTIGWGKLYDEPHLCSCLLTIEFLMTFETVEKNRKLFVKFHLFRKSLVVISPTSVGF